jgi:predicted ester cyclase
MSTETNKATVRRMLEQVWNERRVDLIDEFFTEDVVSHIVGFPSSSGLEEFREGLAMNVNAFPDIKIAEGDKVVFSWTSLGTHQGELYGIPATGKQVKNTGMTIYRMVNTKIAELWFIGDNMGMMQQLGVVPVPGEA